MHYLLYLILTIYGADIKADDHIFKHEGTIVELMDAYFLAVDQKDIQGMLNFYDLPTILHFNNRAPIELNSEDEFKDVFNLWKESPKSLFNHTKQESISVNEIRKNFICVADVVYTRANEMNQIISNGRSLYHFVYKNENWKIYMIVNVEPDQE